MTTEPNYKAALVALNEHDLSGRDLPYKDADTIRRALKIVDALINEEISQEVFEAGFYANDKQYSGDPLDDMVERTRQTFKAMRDQLLKEVE